MNVLIVDDHKIARIGLSLLVNEEYPLSTIDQAGNAAEVLQQIHAKSYQLVLMDLQMPDTDSIILLQQLLGITPNARVLIVSLNPESVFALRYMKAGALGYIQKKEDDVLIRKAIRNVGEGMRYMSDGLLKQLMESFHTKQVGNPFEVLSKREFEIAQHIKKGLTRSSIAALMGLRITTVSNYKMRILDKLNIKTVHELAEMLQGHDIG